MYAWRITGLIKHARYLHVSCGKFHHNLSPVLLPRPEVPKFNVNRGSLPIKKKRFLPHTAHLDKSAKNRSTLPLAGDGITRGFEE